MKWWRSGPAPTFFFPASAKAFTFIEIVLVVVILCVLAGMAVPYLSHSYKGMLLQSSANQAATLMRYAQGRAITHNRTIYFVFEDGRQAYRLQRSSTSGNGGSEHVTYERIPGRWGRLFRIPPEVKVESETEAVAFFPDGQIQKVRISFCRADRCLTVSTREQRGRVLLADGRLEQETE